MLFRFSESRSGRRKRRELKRRRGARRRRASNGSTAGGGISRRIGASPRLERGGTAIRTIPPCPRFAPSRGRARGAAECRSPLCSSFCPLPCFQLCSPFCPPIRVTLSAFKFTLLSPTRPCPNRPTSTFHLFGLSSMTRSAFYGLVCPPRPCLSRCRAHRMCAYSVRPRCLLWTSPAYRQYSLRRPSPSPPRYFDAFFKNIK